MANFAAPLPSGPFTTGSGTPAPDMQKVVGALDEVRTYVGGLTSSVDAGNIVTGTLDPARLPDLGDTYLKQQFDITQITPGYVTEFIGLPQVTVPQMFRKHEESGDFFMSQAYDNRDPLESFAISRLGADGVVKNSINIVNGGHGTIFDIETIAGEAYVWITITHTSAGVEVNDLLRFKWPNHTGNVQWDRSTAGVFTEFPTFETNATRVYAIFDWDNDWVVYQMSSNILKRRKISDVKAGINAVYGTMTLPAQSSNQGYAYVDDYFYRYAGTSDGTFTRRIERYKWENVADRVVVSTELLGRDPDGTVPNNFLEPEGISLYRDPKTRRPTMLAGVGTGYAGARRYMLWAFPSPGISVQSLARNDEAWMRSVPVQKNLRARFMPVTGTTIQDCGQPGWYYMSNAEFLATTDRPVDAPDTSGYFLEVSGISPTTGNVQQRLIRNSGGVQYQWVRIVGTSVDNRSDWYRMNLTAVAYAA